MAEWIEYITSNSNSHLAQMRRRNGRAEPWRLPFIGLGNETWGCGGNMRPEYSADLHRQFVSFVRGVNPAPVRVASGASGDDTRWTEVLMTNVDPRSHMDALSLHYYTLPTGDWSRKGAGVGFAEDEWIGTLQQTLHMEDLIARHGAIMDRRDPERRVGLYVDEWGTWYDPEPGTNPAFLVQPNTMRDAIVAAINLNIFQNHAERVRMANIAQMVNVLQAMIQTDGPRMVLTPTYHVFDLYRPFKDATLLPTQVTASSYEFGGHTVPAIHVSAARTTNARIILALVNLDPNRAADVAVALNGVQARSVSGRILTAAAMDARNTFDAPQTVAPTAFTGARIAGERLSVALPAKSVVVLEIQ
jgi:alpha-N-arabinofuranosidase